MKRWLVLATLAVPALSLAIVRRHDKDDQLYLDLGAQYPSVGRFDYKIPPNLVGKGSGILIFDRWVLTAAHLFDTGASDHKFAVGGDTYTVVDKWIYPGWNGNLQPGFDLALALLDRPVGNVTPAPLWTGDPATLKGKTATIVGFGRTGTGFTGSNVVDGKKRGMRNVVDAAPTFKLPDANGVDYERQAIVDFDSPEENTNTNAHLGSSPTPVDLEGQGAIGDSGGGWFVNENGVEYLFAVSSWITFTNPVGLYGSQTMGVLIDRAWIYETVPEPASMIALAAGLGALALRRRRK